MDTEPTSCKVCKAKLELGEDNAIYHCLRCGEEMRVQKQFDELTR